MKLIDQKKSGTLAMNRSAAVGGLLAAVLLLGGGCTTSRTTDPARSATEQLLLSTAADHALQAIRLTPFAGRKVFLDAAYLDSYDSKFVVGEVRDALSRAGALLEENAANADIIMEVRSGAFSTDTSAYLLGIPNITVPIPLAGPLQTPELAFYKSDQHTSTAKFALLAFARESRSHLYSSGPLDGKSFDTHYKLLFFSWARTDIPEKHKKPETDPNWLPQYDFDNLPVNHTNAVPPASPAPTNAPSPAVSSTNRLAAVSAGDDVK